MDQEAKILRDIKKILILAKAVEESLTGRKFSKAKQQLKKMINLDLDELSRLQNIHGDQKVLKASVMVFKDARAALQGLSEEKSDQIRELVERILELEGLELKMIEASKTEAKLWDMNFDSLVETENKGRNKILVGTKGNKKYFIKQYVAHFDPSREQEYLDNRRCEILCYEHLRWSHIPTFVKADVEKGYLITEFVEAQIIVWSKNMIDLVFNTIIADFAKTSAEFLPKIKYSTYCQDLISKARFLKNENLFKDISLFEKIIKDNIVILESTATHFSHGDPRTANVLVNQGKIYIIDFEGARQDNLMYDIAVMYVDLQNDSLRQYLLQKAKQLHYFHQSIFVIMLLRRCVEMVFSFHHRNLRHISLYGEAVKIFNEISTGGLDV